MKCFFQCYRFSHDLSTFLNTGLRLLSHQFSRGYQSIHFWENCPAASSVVDSLSIYNPYRSWGWVFNYMPDVESKTSSNASFWVVAFIIRMSEKFTNCRPFWKANETICTAWILMADRFYRISISSKPFALVAVIWCKRWLVWCCDLRKVEWPRGLSSSWAGFEWILFDLIWLIVCI